MTWVDPHDFTDGSVLLEEQLDDISGDLRYLHSMAHQKAGGRVPSALWQTTSTTFVDWNGTTPLEVAFDKRGGTETQLRVDIKTTGFVTGGAEVNAQLAVRIGSTDHTNSYPHHFNTVSEHHHMPESVFIGGLAAGTITAKLRVLISAQTFNIDGNDYAQLVISEVYVG